MKKAISFLLILIVLSCGFINTNFAEASTNYVACLYGGSGHHEMYAIGNAECWSGTFENPGTMTFGGTLSQCSGCGLYMISQAYPNASFTWLGQVACSYTVQVSLFTNYRIYSTPIGTYYSTTSDSFIQGFRFH